MTIETYQGKKPQIGKDCFIADSADLIGDVVLGDNASVWHSAVIRADIFDVVIGSGTSIQDNATVHVNHERGTYIGNNVTVGHNVVLHACTVEDGCMIGMGSVILDGVTIGEGSIVAAGSVVSPNKEIPPHSMVMGIPGQVVRTLDENRVTGLLEHAERYVELVHSYLKK